MTRWTEPESGDSAGAVPLDADLCRSPRPGQSTSSGPGAGYRIVVAVAATTASPSVQLRQTPPGQTNEPVPIDKLNLLLLSPQRALPLVGDVLYAEAGPTATAATLPTSTVTPSLSAAGKKWLTTSAPVSPPLLGGGRRRERST